MSETEQLVVRTPAPLSARADRFRSRLDRSRARLQRAVVRVQDAARDMTPAARIEDQPVRWLLGGLAVGLLLGWMSSTRRDR
ncbi:MAG: hypothetical protein ABMB14_06875 [Myxococcota bacterium]